MIKTTILPKSTLPLDHTKQGLTGKSDLVLPTGIAKVSVKKVGDNHANTPVEPAPAKPKRKVHPKQLEGRPHKKTAAEKLAEKQAKAKLKDAPEKTDFTLEAVEGILKEDGLEEVPDRGYNVKATAEEKEFRRKQIMRLMLRGVPRSTIGQYLKLPMPTLNLEIREINRITKQEMLQLDYPLFVGMAVNFYDEARNIALRLATDTNEKSNLVKMHALNVAISAENNKHKYLQMVGLYKSTSPITLNNAENQTSDADDFIDLLQQASRNTVEGVYEQVGLGDNT